MPAKRFLRNLGAFLAGVLLSLLFAVPFARAETIPATSAPANASFYWYINAAGLQGPHYSTPAEAAAVYGVANPGWNCLGSYISPDDLAMNQCTTGTPYGTLRRVWSCASGTLTLTGSGDTRTGVCTGNAYSCPANQGWTLSGSNCVRPDCPSGQTHSTTDGQCRPACAAAGTKDANFNRDMVGTGPMPDTLCVDGCSYDTKGLGVGLGPQGASSWLLTVGRSLGTSCSTSTNGSSGIPAESNTTPAEQATTPESDCVKSGQGFGTVNGVVVCTGPPPLTKEKTTTQTQTTPTSGPATTTETTKTTTCQGGACVTTETTKVIAGGSGPGGTGPGSTSTPGPTTTTTDDEGTFCDKNPTSDKCQKTEPGTPATVTGLYTKDAKTVESVVNSFKATVQGAGFYNAASNYFSASMPSGSCSGMSANIQPPLGAAWHIDLGDYLCGSTAATLYSLLGIGVMLAAGWVAFRIAIL